MRSRISSIFVSRLRRCCAPAARPLAIARRSTTPERSRPRRPWSVGRSARRPVLALTGLGAGAMTRLLPASFARVAELADAQALEACGATRAGSIPASRTRLLVEGASVVQSRVEDLSPVVKKVSVELTPDRVKDALETAYTSVSRTVKLKGYRQGHVPRRLVERYFGDDVMKR